MIASMQKQKKRRDHSTNIALLACAVPWKMARRSLHFRCSDPLSREAASRTTWYRIIKKRRAKDNLETGSTEFLSSYDTQCVGTEPILGSNAEYIEEQRDCGNTSDELDDDTEQQVEEQQGDLCSNEVLTDLLPE